MTNIRREITNIPAVMIARIIATCNFNVRVDAVIQQRVNKVFAGIKCSSLRNNLVKNILEYRNCIIKHKMENKIGRFLWTNLYISHIIGCWHSVDFSNIFCESHERCPRGIEVTGSESLALEVNRFPPCCFWYFSLGYILSYKCCYAMFSCRKNRKVSSVVRQLIELYDFELCGAYWSISFRVFITFAVDT